MKSSVKDRTSAWQKIANAGKRLADIDYWTYRLKWNYYPAFRIAGKAPLHVDIEVTDACNLRCIMCVQGSGMIINTGFIEPELAYRAIDECAENGVYSIKFNFRGEPMLHRSLVDFVAYAKKRGILEVQFNTNGLPADRGKIEELIHAGLDRIIFSVDGATRETYETIRVGGNYDKLVANIETFLEIREKEKRVKPFIRVQMVKYYGAEKEAEQFVRQWTAKKVDNIAVIEKQDRDLKNGYPLRNGKRPVGRKFCEQPWQRLNINRDGKVLMCCGDWDRKTVVGDFTSQTIREIWNSDVLKAYRAQIRKGNLDAIPACKTCFRPATYRWEGEG